VWTHGDFVQLSARGTARILGRSDGVLNVRGIRIGPAEIYHVLQDFPEIAEAMAIEQAAPQEPGGARLVLLVVLRGGAALDRPLTLRIKKELSRRASAAHVPAVIAQVAELPTTFSNKRSEKAARDVLNGRPATNAGALKNPDCLEVIRTHPALQLDPPSS
jgi:acetoacetyl-CoA synthetase